MVNGTLLMVAALLAISKALPVLHEKDKGKKHAAVQEAQYQLWASNFTARNPIHQNYCSNILHNRNGSMSQYDQDLFLFFNIFKYWPMHGKTGYYVDSGANEYQVGSNTYFFDVCLNWEGICVEPDPRYHAGLERHRSCKLVAECISDSNKTIEMVPPKHGAFMTVGGGKKGETRNMKCNSLVNMLSLHSIPRVDLWSLDVEGHELVVLQSVNFGAVDVGVLLVEDYSISTRLLDKLLSERGYNKYHQLPVDTVHVRRTHRLADEVWYPASYNQSWAYMQGWREGKDKPTLIC